MRCITHIFTVLGGGGAGLDYVILLSEGGWVLITVDYGGGERVKMAKKLIA